MTNGGHGFLWQRLVSTDRALWAEVTISWQSADRPGVAPGVEQACSRFHFLQMIRASLLCVGYARPELMRIPLELRNVRNVALELLRKQIAQLRAASVIKGDMLSAVRVVDVTLAQSFGLLWHTVRRRQLIAYVRRSIFGLIRVMVSAKSVPRA